MKVTRHNSILKMVLTYGSVKVSELADYLNVTKETIRTDLNELAKNGYIIRCHGGAYIKFDSIDNIVKNNIVNSFETTNRTKKEMGYGNIRKRICIVGSFNVDIISYLDRLPGVGESLLVDEFIFSTGGKGWNQALAARYAGSEVFFITKIGSDHFTEYAISVINKSPIDKAIIYKSEEEQTGTATIFVNKKSGDNIIAINSGANMTITNDEIALQREEILSSSIILLQLETNESVLKEVIRIAQENNIPVILDPAPYNDFINPLINGLDYITPNETEAGLLTGMSVTDIPSAKLAAKIIHENGVKNTIITLGSNGSIAYDGKIFIYSPAFPTIVKNTAGAGDAFNGALASCIAQNKSLSASLCYASAFASCAVETPNASEMPNNEAVHHRMVITKYKQSFFKN